MIQGSKEGYIERVTPVDLHGQKYFDIAYRTADDPAATMHVARLGDDAIYAAPQPGDRIRLHFLMNLVMKVERLATPSG